jgi:hypothetical protein
MTLFIPNIALAGKQFEIKELKHLKTRVNLAGATAHLIHALQKERGASSVYLASEGSRFKQTRLEAILESSTVETLLRKHIEEQLQAFSFPNAKIITLMGWIVLGLDTLPQLRKRIEMLQLSGNTSVSAFSRLIAGLISLIFEVADTAADPEISQILLALYNLEQGKEFAGQERAVGALLFASGISDESLQQRAVLLKDAQEHNFQVFRKFSKEPIVKKWHNLQNKPFISQLDALRHLLSTASPGTRLNSNLSDNWFEYCTVRINEIWAIQRKLIELLNQQCDQLIEQAERGLSDSKGLVKTLSENPPEMADLIDRFFDPELPIEQSLTFIPMAQESHNLAQPTIALLQEQSQRIAKMEDELYSVKKELSDRKVIERAKGILMASNKLSEDEAYKKMRTISMNQNTPLVQVAESVLSLYGIS